MTTDKSLYQTGGTVAGGAIGSMFGPAGTLIGGGLGGMAGGLIYDIFNGDPVQDASRAKQEEMARAAQAYAAYRPGMYAAHQQGLLQQLQSMNGASNAMRTMYGRQYDPRIFAPQAGVLPNPQAQAGSVGDQLAAMGRR